jgi:hypothetical protein
MAGDGINGSTRSMGFCLFLVSPNTFWQQPVPKFLVLVERTMEQPPTPLTLSIKNIFQSLDFSYLVLTMH